jgi:hypothetical protein
MLKSIRGLMIVTAVVAVLLTAPILLYLLVCLIVLIAWPWLALWLLMFVALTATLRALGADPSRRPGPVPEVVFLADDKPAGTPRAETPDPTRSWTRNDRRD